MLFPVLCRGHAGGLFEGLVEELDIIEAAFLCDVRGAAVGSFQKPAGFGDPKLLDIGGDGGAGDLLENLPETGDRSSVVFWLAALCAVSGAALLRRKKA